MSLFPSHKRQVERLRQQRRDVAAELTEVIEEFAPRLWKDFESQRIVPPSSDTQHSYSASQPVTPKTPIGASWKRKSTFGAESSILQHPMSWIDEKIFGWSTRSGRKRWPADEGATSDATPAVSEAVTPAYRSEESEAEAADYDEVSALYLKYPVNPSNCEIPSQVVRGVEERLASVGEVTTDGIRRLRRRSSARNPSQLGLSEVAVETAAADP